MIEIFDSKSHLDILSEYCLQNKCSAIYFTNKIFEMSGDTEMKDRIISFYSEFLPDDLIEILKKQRDNVIKFQNDETAVINATSWFPKKHLLPGEEYYWYSCVIDSQGDIIFENIPAQKDIIGGA